MWCLKARQFMCQATLLIFLLTAEKGHVEIPIETVYWGLHQNEELFLEHKISPGHHLNHCGVARLGSQWVMKQYMFFYPSVIESPPNATVQLEEPMFWMLLMSGSQFWETSTRSSLMNITYHTVCQVNSFYQCYWHFKPEISGHWWQFATRMLKLKGLNQLTCW